MDGLREWWWAPLRSWEQRHKVILAITWAHLALLLGVKVVHESGIWWVIPIFLIFATIGSISKLKREIRSSSSVVALLTVSFTLLYITEGMLEVHLHVLLVVALIGMYQLRVPLILVITLIFAHHTTVVALGDGERLFANTYELPLLVLVALHVGFAAAIAIVSRVRVRVTRELQSRLDEVTQAFSTTASIAKRGQSRADYAEQARDEFFSVIVHQLKTPITVLQGYAELLLRNDHKTREEQETYLGYIVKGTEAMAKMVDAGMQMVEQKIEGWGVEGKKVDDIGKCIRNIVDEMSVAFQVQCLYAPGVVNTSVEVDEYALKIMLQHLIDNAHEHGSGDVSVEIGEGRRFVEVSVHSWGPVSTSPIDSKACFFPGYKGNKSNGTGLGLWIVKNYADIMSADVEVSQVEDGTSRKTTFTLCLPKERKVSANV